MRISGTIAVAALLLGSSLAWSQEPDRVFLVGGKQNKGTITGMSATEIVVNDAGNNVKIPVNEVLRVTFGEDPPELTTARDRLREGDAEAALAAVNKVDVKAIPRSVIKQDLAFFKASAQAKAAINGSGDKNAAAGAMYAFFNENKENFHYYEAAEILGDLAMSLGKYDDKGASRFYSELSKAPWPDYQLRAAVLEAKPLIALKKYDEALKRYDEVIASTVNTPAATRQKVLAQALRISALAETGKAQEGLAAVNDLIIKNDPKDVELFARLYNARGACNTKLNNPKEALLDYLHVDMLFARDAEAHAEALYNLGQLWTSQNKNDRAVEYRTKLKDSYPSSMWLTRQ